MEIDVPAPKAQPITSEQRMATIAKICGEALYSCTGSFEPLDTLELHVYAERIKVELDAIFEDPRAK
jgi:hypothetical protein